MGQRQRNIRDTEFNLYEAPQQQYIQRQNQPKQTRRTSNRPIQPIIIQRGQIARPRTAQQANFQKARTSRPIQSIKRSRARRRKEFFCRATALLVAVFCLVFIYKMIGVIYHFTHNEQEADVIKEVFEPIIKDMNENEISPPAIIEDYLDINEYSRPGTPLNTVKNIFVHYTANKGTSAEQNRSYFANLALTHERSASAHFIIGYDGKLIQCIPLDEEAYAVMTRNSDSISIECCFLAEDGSFTQETYDTLIHTLAWLLNKYQLSTDDILRHYDCGGKLCPIYYVENEDAWDKLLQDVAAFSADHAH